MDHKTNKQEPSSKEGGQVKKGDKVWVRATVTHNSESSEYMELDHNGYEIIAHKLDCRPVEPANSSEIPNRSSEAMREAFESSMAKRYDWYQGYFSRNENRYFDSSVEMAWQSFQAGAKYQPSPLAPSPCMDGVNVDQFIDGIMEARGRTSGFQVGDAVRFVWPGHKWHGTEGTIVLTTVDIKEHPYRFRSDCGAFERWCSVDQLERINKADPINPSHYKQGGIECIEAIKAATGDGFVGYVWGNVLKYLWRWPKKGGVDDLKKARWYLDRLIQEAGE
jgi:hypothetical protein